VVSRNLVASIFQPILGIEPMIYPNSTTKTLGITEKEQLQADLGEGRHPDKPYSGPICHPYYDEENTIMYRALTRVNTIQLY